MKSHETQCSNHRACAHVVFNDTYEEISNPVVCIGGKDQGKREFVALPTKTKFC